MGGLQQYARGLAPQDVALVLRRQEEGRVGLSALEPLDAHGSGKIRDPARQISGKTGFVEGAVRGDRSEEHTSELQSLMRISYAVFCLKKKKTKNKKTMTMNAKQSTHK